MADSVLVMPGSTRAGSHNAALGAAIVDRLVDRGVAAEFVDLREFPLPLFDPELEAADGVPAAARRLHDLLARHAGLVIVTPEYNGSISTLLKNTIDWISRVDRSVLQRPVVALASASPSSKGGATGRASLRAMCDHMGVGLLDRELGLARSHEVIVEGVIDDGQASAEIDAFVAAVAEAFG
jgi:NAD(P)H-dependent FMN reductase